MDYEVWEDEDKEDVFIFLDKLRESGLTNMYGAVPFIVAEFDTDNKAASILLGEWMATFEARHP